MSPGQETVIVIVVVAVVGAIVIFASYKGLSSTTTISVADLIKVEVKLDSEVKEKSADAAGKAAAVRQRSVDEAVQQVRERISSLERVHLRRLLWVDDHPDNNVFENIALGELGFIITTATSNQAASQYLRATRFDLVITDLGRDNASQMAPKAARADDGAALVAQLAASTPDLPVVVYTSRADPVRDELISIGAVSVEDEPGRLVAAAMDATNQRAG